MVKDVKVIGNRYLCMLKVDKRPDNVAIFHIPRGIVISPYDKDPGMTPACRLYQVVQIEEVLVVVRYDRQDLSGA